MGMDRHNISNDFEGQDHRSKLKFARCYAMILQQRLELKLNDIIWVKGEGHGHLL